MHIRARTSTFPSVFYPHSLSCLLATSRSPVDCGLAQPSVRTASAGVAIAFSVNFIVSFFLFLAIDFADPRLVRRAPRKNASHVCKHVRAHTLYYSSAKLPDNFICKPPRAIGRSTRRSAHAPFEVPFEVSTLPRTVFRLLMPYFLPPSSRFIPVTCIESGWLIAFI